MCFQVGAFGVNFPAAVKVAAMHPPPAIRGGVPAALVTGLPRSPSAHLPGGAARRARSPTGEGSLLSSGDDGGVEVADELRVPELTKTSPMGSEVLVVGESSSELSEDSLLTSEFRLLVSRL